MRIAWHQPANRGNGPYPTSLLSQLREKASLSPAVRGFVTPKLNRDAHFLLVERTRDRLQGQMKCGEESLDYLLMKLAAHRLDLVLSDSPLGGDNRSSEGNGAPLSCRGRGETGDEELSNDARAQLNCSGSSGGGLHKGEQLGFCLA